MIGCSDFRLFANFVEGLDIDPICAERAVLGFNDLRVFLSMKGSLGTFDPRPHLDQLPAFIERVASFGLRLELTLFADTQRWLPDPDEQRALFRIVCELIQNFPSVRLEGINEANVHDNAAPGIVNELEPDVIWALGSNGADQGTALPVKRYATYHPARTFDWPRKAGHNAYEDVANKYDIPCVSNETKRPDEDGYHESNFFDAAANVALMCAGAVMHSTAGKASAPFSPDERRCAEAWVAGANAVPLRYRSGRYTRGGLADCPIVHKDEWASRTHVRILGDDACCVVSQRQPGWTLQTRGAWHLVTQNESVIELVR